MRRRFLISGTVQGVGFRHFARQEGRRIGVTGWVGNLADRRVEARADGSPDQLTEFERVLRRGPMGALVTDIHAEDISGEVSWPITFEIR